MNEQVSSYTKEELEKQKLAAEIANLKKPWIKNPVSWVSIMTIALALFGLAFQYRNHKFEEAEAQRKLADVNGELKDVQEALSQKEPRLKQVDAEIDGATKQLSQLTSEREQLQKQLATLNEQLKDLQAKANSLPATPDNQKIKDSVKVAAFVIGDLQKKNESILDKSKSVTESLTRAKLKSSVISIAPQKDKPK